jgi:hypothetical protein
LSSKETRDKIKIYDTKPVYDKKNLYNQRK